MIDFGLVDAVDAEAIGEPGARTFRLRAASGSSRAALWMEKEQLTGLGHAISALLAERARSQPRVAPQLSTVEDIGPHPDVELQIVRLGLDYDGDGDRDVIVLLADDREALQRGDSPAFRMEISRAHALGVTRQISAIVSAGRPLCPLCGTPLEGDGQHFCPGSNGHSRDLELPAADGDDPTA